MHVSERKYKDDRHKTYTAENEGGGQSAFLLFIREVSYHNISAQRESQSQKRRMGVAVADVNQGLPQIICRSCIVECRRSDWYASTWEPY